MTCADDCISFDLVEVIPLRRQEDEPEGSQGSKAAEDAEGRGYVGSQVRLHCVVGERRLSSCSFSASCEFDGNPCELQVLVLRERVSVNGGREFLLSFKVPEQATLCRVRVVARRLFSSKEAEWQLDALEFSAARARRVALSLHAQEAPHHEWMLAHQAHADELMRQRDETRSWRGLACPLISIVTPVFQTPPDYLRQMVDSVLAQSYERLELVLANASGPCEDLERVLASYDDERIRIIEIENVDIATNTNAAIAVAQGDYVAFIDHDDFIEPDTLYRYVCALHEHPKADLLFCDEDLCKLSDGAWRFEGPRFKPGWNPDLLFTHDYVCHMLMVSRRALELTERSTPELAGAQDYDLTLKVAELAREICHVPELLYHWRVHEQSTALNRDSKPYALEAGRLAVQGHFDRKGPAATIGLGAHPFSYRVQYHLPEPAVSVSLLLACIHEDEVGLARALATIRRKTEYPWDRYELVIAASRGFAKAARRVVARCLRKVDWGSRTVQVIESARPDAASLYNVAAAVANRELLVLLDDRCAACEGNWLTELIEPLRRDDVGCSSPMLLDGDGLLQALGLILREDGSLGPAGRGLEITDCGYMSLFFHARDCSLLPTCGLAIRRGDWDAFDGVEPSLGALAAQGLCLRLREAGKLLVCEPYGPLMAYENVVGGETEGERRALISRHPSIAAGDEYLNHHLDPKSDFFSLASPVEETPSHVRE